MKKIFLILSLILVLSGCGKEDDEIRIETDIPVVNQLEDVNEKNSLELTNNKEIVEHKENDKTEENVNKSENNYAENNSKKELKFEQINDNVFVPFESIIEDTFEFEEIKNINLYEDSFSEITIFMPAEDELNIKINDKLRKDEIDLTEYAKLSIVDLNKHDAFKEIAVMDWVPTLGMVVYFYRYDGDEIIKLGEYWTTSARDLSNTYIDIETGTIVDILTDFLPNIIDKYVTIIDNKLIENDLDTYNKEFEIDGNYEVAWADLEWINEPIRAWYYWPFDKEIEIKLKTGDKLKVLDITRDYAEDGRILFLKVELDGEEGYIKIY